MEYEAAVPAEAHRAGANRECDREQKRREHEHQNAEPVTGDECDESDDEENEGDERHEGQPGRNAEPHRGALVRREDLGDLLARQLELLADVGAHVLADSAEERAVTGSFVHGPRLYRRATHSRLAEQVFCHNRSLRRGGPTWPFVVAHAQPHHAARHPRRRNGSISSPTGRPKATRRCASSWAARARGSPK